MVYSSYKRQRIVYHYLQGHKAPTICKLLSEEGLKASRVGIDKFLKKFSDTGCIGRRVGSGRRSKITREIKAIVDRQMALDDETTTIQLHAILTNKHGINISRRTILRCRISLGWTFRGSAYCQLIREANKVKRLECCQTHPYSDEALNDVLFTDECTVQLESHRRFSCRKIGQQPRPKPR